MTLPNVPTRTALRAEVDDALEIVDDRLDALEAGGGGGGGPHSHTSAGITDFNTAVDARAQLLINALVAGAPGLLDTLDELAAALGDDQNFAATVTTALAGKQPSNATLTALAALALADGTVLARQGGAFTMLTYAALKAALALDHGELAGLGDDDHAQYFNQVRGDARYVRPAQLSTVATTGAYADLTGKPSIPDSPDDIGAAALAHQHTSGDVTDFSVAVDARIALIIDAAPSSLDTLNELAAALGDDPNFAGTITALIGTKQPLSAVLTQLSAIAAADNDVIQRKAGSFTNRTPVQLKDDLGLTKGDVGLGNAPNLVPGDDSLGLYGYHSATAHISSFRTEFGQNNEIWIARILVRAGRAITKIGTLVKAAGVLGVGGVNGFALATDDGSSLLFSVDNDNLWTTSGDVSVSLGGASIAAQPNDVFYRAQMSVQGYSTPPTMLLNQGDHAVLSDFLGRARFANASAGFQGGGAYNPLTFGTSTNGFYPFIMIG